MKDIQIRGFSAKQQLIADIVWQLDTMPQIREFIGCLPASDRVDAEIVVDMIIHACLDQVDNTELAQQELSRFYI